MKIKNISVSIKNGNKEIELHNLILNSYLDLFADSFLKFKDKTMYNCLIKFDEEQTINIDDRVMNYDTIYECDFYKIRETYTNNNIINDYIYNKEVVEQLPISDFVGHKITGLGFGSFNYDTMRYEIYAFLDVSAYNIIVQEGQEITISRKDKVSSDLIFYSPFDNVKYPTHLTVRGIIESQGNDFNTIYSELYSIGLGNLYNHILDEIPVADLDFKKIDIGVLGIEGAKDYSTYPALDLYPKPDLYPGRTASGLSRLEIAERKNSMYPSRQLYPSNSTYPRKATKKWVIYKFKLYRKRYEGIEEIIEDTGLYYLQSQKTDLTGDIKLKIKYERED